MAGDATITQAASPRPEAQPVSQFGVNEVRLGARLWCIVLSLLGLALWLTPVIWKKVERFNTGPDYRLPYDLSKDYWLYQRRLKKDVSRSKVLLLGDSVVWGEYVLPDGTLSHFLNAEAGTRDRFVNGGLNGLFPLAQQGLIKHYAGAVARQKVLLQCNVLWMTSPKADLSTDKEEQFNHSTLVPQFFPRIPCYRASANDRLSAEIANHVDFIAWVAHVQIAYFDQKSIPNWTLQDDGNEPPRYPNAYKNPLSRITLQVPTAPANDPLRGPLSPRHKPWTSSGQGQTRFDWVSLDASLQWRAFQQVVRILKQRGNDVFVLVGPFNQHMIAEDNLPAFRSLNRGIIKWLESNQVPLIAPDPLPTELYADASHPLTDGYKQLAHELAQDRNFQAWLTR
ncbi:MAG TPA: hypothetical protein VKY92_06840 [Verrucomicrobiae bacterium]|nr:hypothetical protein [Verrucomicrobiae bacterium]